MLVSQFHNVAAACESVGICHLTCAASAAQQFESTQVVLLSISATINPSKCWTFNKIKSKFADVTQRPLQGPEVTYAAAKQIEALRFEGYTQK